MKMRLLLCSDDLQEIEKELIERQSAMLDDPKARADIREALNLIHDANGTISPIKLKIETLRHWDALTPQR